MSSVLADISREPQHDPFLFLLNVTNRFGDAVEYETAYGRTFLFNHPDYIHEVLHRSNFTRTSLIKILLGEGLLASDGEYWKGQRRMLQPSFRPEQIANFGSLVVECTGNMIERWRDKAVRRQPLDVSTEVTRLTLRVVAKALFSDDLGDKMQALCDATTTLMQDLGAIGSTQLNLHSTFSPSSKARLDEALQTVDDIVYGLIHHRRQSTGKPDDLLTKLLRLSGEACGELEDRQVRDEVVTLVISGHETTSLILSWAFYLLSQHPTVESRLHEELDRVLGARTPSVEDLDSLPYTRMVLQESMRLYPPVWFIARKTVEDDRVGDVDIPANSPVLVSPYAMHRHPSFWRDPEQFDPERFTAERIENRPRYAYIPFGGGRHLCIGNHFAMMEGRLTLAMIAQRFRIHTVPGHRVVPEPALTLRQRDGFVATLSERGGGN